MTLRGLGVTHLRGTGRGDLIIHANVQTPTRLDERAGGPAPPARRRCAARSVPRVGCRPPTRGLFGKLRDAFKAK